MIFIGIKSREIPGYRGIQLLKRDLPKEIEVITMMWFESITSIIEFAGKDYEKSIVPDKEQKILLRFDQRSQHYEVCNDFQPQLRKIVY